MLLAGGLKQSQERRAGKLTPVGFFLVSQALENTANKSPVGVLIRHIAKHRHDGWMEDEAFVMRRLFIDRA